MRDPAAVYRHRVARDHEAHRLSDAPNRLGVADVTCVPIWAGFVYLAIVLDVSSRRIAGWSTANHLRTEPVLNALNTALALASPSRRPYLR